MRSGASSSASRLRAVACHRRQVDRRFGVREQPLQPHAPLALGDGAQVLPVDGDCVERDERGGRVLRELGDARRGRVESHLQGVEVEPARCGDHDLAVQHRAGREPGQQGVMQLGKVAVERPQIAALDEDLCRAAEHDRAKPVPLRLVEKRVAGGER